MIETRALIGLLLLLAACGEPPPRSAEHGTQASSPTSPAEPPTPEPEAFYVGRWAASEAQCASQAWIFSRASLQAPDGTCVFDEVARVPDGYRLRGTCRWVSADEPADIGLSFAQSAQALLVSGQPVGDLGLIACS